MKRDGKDSEFGIRWCRCRHGEEKRYCTPRKRIQNASRNSATLSRLHHETRSGLVPFSCGSVIDRCRCWRGTPVTRSSPGHWRPFQSGGWEENYRCLSLKSVRCTSGRWSVLQGVGWSVSVLWTQSWVRWAGKNLFLFWARRKRGRREEKKLQKSWVLSKCGW